jgi:MFS family permease
MGQTPAQSPGAAASASLLATLVGSFLVRAGGAATGVMLGLLLARLHRAGDPHSTAMAASLIAASYSLAELVGAPVVGWLIDRQGLRVFLIAGPILGVVAELFFGGPSYLTILTGARLLQGLTTACTIPAALAFMAESTRSHPEGRGRLMGFFEVSSVGGIAIGFVLGGFLWDVWHRSGFWLLVAVYGLAVVLFVLVRTERRPQRGPSLAVTLGAVSHATDLMPAWLALTAAAGLWFGQAAYQLSGAHPRAHQHLTSGFSGTTIGIIFGVYALLFALGTIGWGYGLRRISLPLALRLGAGGLLIAGGSLYGINHLGSFGGPAFFAMILLAVVGLAAETAFTPAALTLLAARSDLVHAGRGAIMGVYSMLLAGGQLLGALLGGAAAAAWGIDGLIAATCLLGIVGLATMPGPADGRDLLRGGEPVRQATS